MRHLLALLSVRGFHFLSLFKKPVEHENFSVDSLKSSLLFKNRPPKDSYVDPVLGIKNGVFDSKNEHTNSLNGGLEDKVNHESTDATQSHQIDNYLTVDPNSKDTLNNDESSDGNSLNDNTPNTILGNNALNDTSHTISDNNALNDTFNDHTSNDILENDAPNDKSNDVLESNDHPTTQNAKNILVVKKTLKVTIERKPLKQSNTMEAHSPLDAKRILEDLRDMKRDPVLQKALTTKDKKVSLYSNDGYEPFDDQLKLNNLHVLKSTFSDVQTTDDPTDNGNDSILSGNTTDQDSDDIISGDTTDLGSNSILSGNTTDQDSNHIISGNTTDTQGNTTDTNAEGNVIPNNSTQIPDVEAKSRLLDMNEKLKDTKTTNMDKIKESIQTLTNPTLEERELGTKSILNSIDTLMNPELSQTKNIPNEDSNNTSLGNEHIIVQSDPHGGQSPNESIRTSGQSSMSENSHTSEHSHTSEQGSTFEHGSMAEQSHLSEQGSMAEQSHMSEQSHLSEQGSLAEQSHMSEQSHLSEQGSMAEQSHVSEQGSMAEQSHMSEQSHLSEQGSLAEQSHMSEQSHLSEQGSMAEQSHVSEQGSVVVKRTQVSAISVPIKLQIKNIQQDEKLKTILNDIMTKNDETNRIGPKNKLQNFYEVPRSLKAKSFTKFSVVPEVQSILYSNGLSVSKSNSSNEVEGVLNSHSDQMSNDGSKAVSENTQGITSDNTTNSETKLMSDNVSGMGNAGLFANSLFQRFLKESKGKEIITSGGVLKNDDLFNNMTESPSHLIEPLNMSESKNTDTTEPFGLSELNINHPNEPLNTLDSNDKDSSERLSELDINSSSEPLDIPDAFKNDQFLSQKLKNMHKIRDPVFGYNLPPNIEVIQQQKQRNLQNLLNSLNKDQKATNLMQNFDYSKERISNTLFDDFKELAQTGMPKELFDIIESRHWPDSSDDLSIRRVVGSGYDSSFIEVLKGLGASDKFDSEQEKGTEGMDSMKEKTSSSQDSTQEMANKSLSTSQDSAQILSTKSLSTSQDSAQGLSEKNLSNSSSNPTQGLSKVSSDSTRDSVEESKDLSSSQKGTTAVPEKMSLKSLLETQNHEDFIENPLLLDTKKTKGSVSRNEKFAKNSVDPLGKKILIQNNTKAIINIQANINTPQKDSNHTNTPQKDSNQTNTDNTKKLLNDTNNTKETSDTNDTKETIDINDTNNTKVLNDTKDTNNTKVLNDSKDAEHNKDNVEIKSDITKNNENTGEHDNNGKNRHNINANFNNLQPTSIIVLPQQEKKEEIRPIILMPVMKEIKKEQGLLTQPNKKENESGQSEFTGFKSLDSQKIKSTFEKPTYNSHSTPKAQKESPKKLTGKESSEKLTGKESPENESLDKLSGKESLDKLRESPDKLKESLKTLSGTEHTEPLNEKPINDTKQEPQNTNSTQKTKNNNQPSSKLEINPFPELKDQDKTKKKKFKTPWSVESNSDDIFNSSDSTEDTLSEKILEEYLKENQVPKEQVQSKNTQVKGSRDTEKIIFNNASSLGLSGEEDKTTVHNGSNFHYSSDKEKESMTQNSSNTDSNNMSGSQSQNSSNQGLNNMSGSLTHNSSNQDSNHMSESQSQNSSNQDSKNINKSLSQNSSNQGLNHMSESQSQNPSNQGLNNMSDSLSQNSSNQDSNNMSKSSSHNPETLDSNNINESLTKNSGNKIKSVDVYGKKEKGKNLNGKKRLTNDEDDIVSDYSSYSTFNNDLNDTHTNGANMGEKLSSEKNTQSNMKKDSNSGKDLSTDYKLDAFDGHSNLGEKFSAEKNTQSNMKKDSNSGKDISADYKMDAFDGHSDLGEKFSPEKNTQSNMKKDSISGKDITADYKLDAFDGHSNLGENFSPEKNLGSNMEKDSKKDLDKISSKKNTPKEKKSTKNKNKIKYPRIVTIQNENKNNQETKAIKTNIDIANQSKKKEEKEEKMDKKKKIKDIKNDVKQWKESEKKQVKNKDIKKQPVVFSQENENLGSNRISKKITPSGTQNTLGQSDSTGLNNGDFDSQKTNHSAQITPSGTQNTLGQSDSTGLENGDFDSQKTNHSAQITPSETQNTLGQSDSTDSKNSDLDAQKTKHYAKITPSETQSQVPQKQSSSVGDNKETKSSEPILTNISPEILPYETQRSSTKQESQNSNIIKNSEDALVDLLADIAADIEMNQDTKEFTKTPLNTDIDRSAQNDSNSNQSPLSDFDAKISDGMQKNLDTNVSNDSLNNIVSSPIMSQDTNENLMSSTNTSPALIQSAKNEGSENNSFKNIASLPLISQDTQNNPKSTSDSTPSALKNDGPLDGILPGLPQMPPMLPTSTLDELSSQSYDDKKQNEMFTLDNEKFKFPHSNPLNLSIDSSLGSSALVPGALKTSNVLKNTSLLNPGDLNMHPTELVNSNMMSKQPFSTTTNGAIF